MRIEIKIPGFIPSFFYWCSMYRWSILKQIGFLLFGVVLSYTYIRSHDPGEPTEPEEPTKFEKFDAQALRSHLHVFDSTLANLHAHEALLKLPNVERPELLRGFTFCRNLVGTYNSVTGNMSSDDLPKFKEHNLPLRLSTEDCK